MMIEKNQSMYDDMEETDDFLSQVSIELLEEGFKYQLKDPLNNRKMNYIDTFYKRFRLTMNRLEDMAEDDIPEEEMNDLLAGKDDFIAYVGKLIYKYLGVGIPDYYDMNDEDQEELLDMIYRYFIKDIKKNFVSVVIHYIENNKELPNLVEQRKDVTTAAFADIMNDNDIKLISNLDKIIEMTFDADYDIEEFIDATLYRDQNTEGLYIKDAFNNNKITGNFLDKYLVYVSDFYVDILTKVRHYIIDKYPSYNGLSYDTEEE